MTRKRPRHSAPAAPPPKRLMVVQRDFVYDLTFWVDTDRRPALRVLRLMVEIARDPLGGIGKPEVLKDLRGIWSRRLDEEHRITYRIDEQHVYFLNARFHYAG